MIAFQKLSDEKLTELQQLGFVHVTGLETGEFLGRAENFQTVKADESHFGKWDYNNSMTVIITVDGQVWLSFYNKDQYRVQALVHTLCPNGKGAFVPCSNGEAIHSSALFRRLADPYEGSEMTADRLFSRA